MKKEKDKLENEIKSVEEKIAIADPKAANVIKKLVAVDTVRVQNFSHYIDLQGKISSNGIGYVAPKGQGGLIRAIYESVGQRVGVGQQVVKLIDETEAFVAQTPALRFTDLSSHGTFLPSGLLPASES